MKMLYNVLTKTVLALAMVALFVLPVRSASFLTLDGAHDGRLGFIPPFMSVATDDVPGQVAPSEVCGPDTRTLEFDKVDLGKDGTQLVEMPIAQLAADPDVMIVAGNPPAEWAGYTILFADPAQYDEPMIIYVHVYDANGCEVATLEWTSELVAAGMDGVITPGYLESVGMAV